MMNRRLRGGPRLSKGPGLLDEVLDHFVSAGTWRVPSQMLLPKLDSPDDWPCLVFSTDPPHRTARPDPGLLEGFLKLHQGTEEAILRYAKRWGPLWLCGHQLPFRHSSTAQCSLDTLDWPVDGVDDEEQVGWCVEGTENWRSVSRQAAAMVRIARQLHNGVLGRREDWSVLTALPQAVYEELYLSVPGGITRQEKYADQVRGYLTQLKPQDFDEEEGVESGVVDGQDSETQDIESDALEHTDFDEETLGAAYVGLPPGTGGSAMYEDPYLEPDGDEHRRMFQALVMTGLEKSIEFQRQMLEVVLNYWLKGASVQPRLNWSGDKPVVHLDGQGLFGALAVQLLFECSRTGGLVVCTSCGTPFLPAGRRPRRDHNPYCSACGLKAAQRDAAARYRQSARYRATYQKWVSKRRGSSSTS